MGGLKGRRTSALLLHSSSSFRWTTMDISKKATLHVSISSFLAFFLTPFMHHAIFCRAEGLKARERETISRGELVNIY